MRPQNELNTLLKKLTAGARKLHEEAALIRASDAAMGEPNDPPRDAEPAPAPQFSLNSQTPERTT